MEQEVKTIDLGGVNCYLVKTGDGGYVLIDTGLFARRADLERELLAAGCEPGTLRLIILTHGDMDHADNCAYLRDRFGAKIAMHHDDAGMVERGDMSWNRKARPDRISLLGRIIMPLGGLLPLLSGRQGKFDGFKPDIYLEDGQDLSGYSFDARVLHVPGHSKGSIGILTAGGDLFCGDLLMNMFKPDCHFLIDDLASFEASVRKLKASETKVVYPGHGKPFPLEKFTKNHR